VRTAFPGRATFDIGADMMNMQFNTQSRPADHGAATRAGGHPSDSAGYVAPFWGPVVIRMATAGDRNSLERLAQLDSTDPPTGGTLIAELRERAVAALSLNDGTAIADPFVPTSDIVALLRLRATQLNAQRRRSHLPRFVRAEA
jgi:hypothetical protein